MATSAAPPPRKKAANAPPTTRSSPNPPTSSSRSVRARWRSGLKSAMMRFLRAADRTRPRAGVPNRAKTARRPLLQQRFQACGAALRADHGQIHPIAAEDFLRHALQIVAVHAVDDAHDIVD